MTAPFDGSSCDSDGGRGDRASGSGDFEGDSWTLSMLRWLSPLTEPTLSIVAPRVESRSEGALDNDEDVWLDGLVEPFMVPAIDGRGPLGGGPIEGLFVGESKDFRAVSGAVVVSGAELLESADEAGCLVGDLVGDYISQLECRRFCNTLRQHLPPTWIQVQTSLQA